MWNYWPLKFPTKAEADALLFNVDGANYTNLDVIGLIDGAMGWHVNIAVIGDIPTPLLSYVIPFPLFPKRVWFVDKEGVV